MEPPRPDLDEVLSKRTGRATIAIAAGMFVAPVAFTAAVVLQGYVHPGYSHIELPISALAAWPGGWLQSVNFVLIGSFIIAFATALHVGIHHGRNGLVGPGLLALGGIGLLMAAGFPWRRVEGDFVVPAGHLLAAVLTFVGSGTGLIVISRRMVADRRWRNLAAYTLTSGVVMLLLLVLIMGFARAEDMPLHPWAGLLQRLVLAIWFPCIMILAWRLWRVMHSRYPSDAHQNDGE